jgi:hypothetical protein
MPELAERLLSLRASGTIVRCLTAARSDDWSLATITAANPVNLLRSCRCRRYASRHAEVVMTIGTGTLEDPLEVVDWSGFYGWGIWRTGAHYGGPFEGPPSTPLVTGTFEGVVNYAFHSIPRKRGDARPLLAKLLPDGSWHAMHFIDADGGPVPISPDATEEQRERQRDRYDRCHAGIQRWYKTELTTPEYYPHTVEVGDKGYWQ